MADEHRGASRFAIDIAPTERLPVLWSGAYFFCLLCCNAVVRPVRDALGISGGVKGLPWLFTGTLAAMLVLGPVMSLVVRRLPRTRFVPLLYYFFCAHLLGFAALLHRAAPGLVVARAFFIWGSVFNLFALSLFWGVMADLYRRDQGQRLFGFIGAGGTLGSVCGSALAAGLAQRLGHPALLLIAAALLAGGVSCFRRLLIALGPDAAACEPVPGPAEPFGGITAVLRSRYLLAICLYLLLYTMSSTAVYFAQAHFVAASFGKADAAGRTAFFARIDLAVNVLTVLGQALLSGRVMAAVGVGGALLVLPLLTLGGFVALGVAPGLWTLVVFQVLRRATDYSIAKPAREVLFTVVRQQDKYAAKSFIDTFVYRGGDALAAWGLGLLPGAGQGDDHRDSGQALLCVSPLLLLWLGVGVVLGRWQAGAPDGPPVDRQK